MSETSRAGRVARTPGRVTLNEGPSEVLYTVSDVARRLGFSPATLRLWERQGLIFPLRSPNGYRLYRQADLDRLHHIVRLRNVDKLSPVAIRRVLDSDPRPLNAAVADTPQPSRDADVAPGPRLRRLRHEQGHTLEQVASGTGLSVSFLSSFERGQTGVSVSTLMRLLNFYGTTLTALLENASTGRSARLTRAASRPKIAYSSGKVTMEQLSTGPAVLEPHLLEVQPGGDSEGGYAHQGEEFLYMLEGSLEVTLGDSERYLLRPGDCLYYPSTLDHKLRNPGETLARAIWVNSPAKL